MSILTSQNLGNIDLYSSPIYFPLSFIHLIFLLFITLFNYF